MSSLKAEDLAIEFAEPESQPFRLGFNPNAPGYARAAKLHRWLLLVLCAGFAIGGGVLLVSGGRLLWCPGCYTLSDRCAVVRGQPGTFDTLDCIGHDDPYVRFLACIAWFALAESGDTIVLQVGESVPLRG